MPVNTIVWKGNSVRIIDQTLLPGKLVYLDCRDVAALWDAIKQLKVRGAPALGIAAAFGVLLGIRTFKGADTRSFIRFVEKLCDHIGIYFRTPILVFRVRANHLPFVG